MQISGSRPLMRAKPDQGKPKPWFRVENAFKGDSDQEVTPVYIYDIIGDGGWFDEGTSAADFIKMVGTIETPKIELHLNSPGGDIFDGVAIYNALRAWAKADGHEVHVVVDALAASAASFIAQAGDTVTMTQGSMMMIHDGSGVVFGNASDMRSTADLLDKLSNNIAGIYADRAGQSTEFWRNLMIEEVWYNAQEAVDSGLADSVGDETKAEDDAAAQNKWDMSVFNYSGRGAAPNPFSVRQRIANQLKENIVPKATNSGTDPVEPTADDPVEPVDPTEDEPVEPTPAPAAPAAPATPPAPEAKVTVELNDKAQPVFMLGGQPTTDFNAVQQRLDVLENFRTETIKQSKIDFVLQLASDNKIGAPQIDSLTTYAQGLDDAGYENWKATWDAAAPLPMLAAKHAGAGVTNPDGSQTEEAKNAADELDIKRDIVKSHKQAGMSTENIMKTDSYKRLMELDPTYKL